MFVNYITPQAERPAMIVDFEQFGNIDAPQMKAILIVFNPDAISFPGWVNQGREVGQWDFTPEQKNGGRGRF